MFLHNEIQRITKIIQEKVLKNVEKKVVVEKKDKRTSNNPRHKKMQTQRQQKVGKISLSSENEIASFRNKQHRQGTSEIDSVSRHQLIRKWPRQE